MSEVTKVQINKITEAVNKIRLASKNLATATKDNKKCIITAASCVTGLALIGSTAYVITKMIKPTFVAVHMGKNCECKEKRYV